MKSAIRPFIILIVLSLSALSFALMIGDQVVLPEPLAEEYDLGAPINRYEDFVKILPEVRYPQPELWPTPSPASTIPVIVIPAAGRAEQTSQPSGATVKELNIMCRVFERELKLPELKLPLPAGIDPYMLYLQNHSHQPSDLLTSLFSGQKIRNTRCIYLEGYAVLFLMNVNFQLTAPPPLELPKEKPKEKPADPVDKVWEQIKGELYGPKKVPKNQVRKASDINKVEQLTTSIAKTLKHAANIQCLKPDEFVIVTVNGNEQTIGAPTVLTVRAKKSDIDAFAKATLNLDQFREKVQITTPPIRKRGWGPEQATGKPDTPPDGTLIGAAWASKTADGQDEWLLLKYEKPLIPVRVEIHEVGKPGAVYKVSAFNEDGKEVEVWSGQDPTPWQSKSGVSKIPLKMDFKTQYIKVYLHSKGVVGWNEIDAVGLVDEADKTYWAVSAQSSSTRAEK